MHVFFRFFQGIDRGALLSISSIEGAKMIVKISGDRQNMSDIMTSVKLVIDALD